ncbi:MAG: cysteine peptidase family C39 domain-containing protein [Verrucomicrobiota bacterium]
MTRFSKLLLLITVTPAMITSCQHHARTGTGPAFEKKYADFTYTEVTPVRQSNQSACGAAALASILQYWNQPTTQSQLLSSYPPQTAGGYPIVQLKRISEVQGLQAFLVTPKENPASFLESQITKGRPVLVAILCPKGRYFGKPLPVIEQLDSETINTPGSKWKEHYVVVTGFDDSQFLIMDPAYGIVALQKHDLLRFWREMNYATLLCST